MRHCDARYYIGYNIVADHSGRILNQFVIFLSFKLVHFLEKALSDVVFQMHDAWDLRSRVERLGKPFSFLVFSISVLFLILTKSQ